ncbi:MAG: FAD-dependent oxidoreductase [Bacteroidales bacterium]|nr:FAD-dependent oxidoreductase [Bacteroidales bacterium]
MKKLLLSLLVIPGILLTGCINDKGNDPANTADVIIYGGTSAAITAAVQVIKMGKSVIIVCPDIHLGGLSSSGLGYTDTGNKGVIGGLSREFYQRIYQYYQKPETWKWQKKEEYGNTGQGTPAIDGDLKTMWIFEPNIAEKIFEDFVSEYNIEVHRDEWLNREKGVVMKNGKIISITTLCGKTYKGKVFVDATYEGDLMAAAGVNYFVGREANSVYGEEWDGVQVGVLHHGHHFGDMQISPYVVPDDPSSGVLARISTEHPGEKDAGDNKLQAYCFRTCLTKVEENRIPFARPEVYDSTQYELLLRVYDAGWRQTFNKFDPIPNAKTDVNNHGPFSFDNIGMNYDYPEATYERRKEILKEHETYQKGLLYFIANDPRVPEEVRSEMKQWGLSKDEFPDNGHWPHQIYVREARRMIGKYVMTENEIMDKKPVNESIGMGSYTMDSHNTQRYIKPDGFVQNEGDIGVRPPKPYRIALGAILPKKEECPNLLVPVALSSSHIAFGSIRMEPVFMILGQSAGTMAAMAIERKTGIHDLSYDEIRQRLIENGQVLEYAE